MSELDQEGWRNIYVRRNRKYENIVHLLCNNACSDLNKPLFEFNKDLMVFAAMLGYSRGKMEPIDNDSIQIFLSVYASDEKDGYIYLLALIISKDPQCLKEAQIRDSVKIFEEYCNGGLSIIESWLQENPGDTEGVDTLVSKILEELASQAEKSVVDLAAVEVDF